MTRTIVLTGAGISTDSGIPDFRGPDGVWQRFDPMSFTIERFHADPAGFWDRRARLVHELGYLEAEPNEAHRFLAGVAARGDVIVTQNLDGLHAKAGTPPERLIEVHGNGAWCRCVDCGGRTATVAVLDQRAPREAPRCTCGGLLKPDVVLFGEPVPALHAAVRALEAADRLVAVGTSLQVWPVAGLVGHALESGLEVHVVNREATPYDPHVVVHRRAIIDALRSLFPGST